MDPSLAQIERYQVLEEVGRGGMAVVYRGRDLSLDRDVAIKVLHAHLADAPDSRARFQREARAVAKLHHRNIIEIYDFADADSHAGPSYLVTEFIEGQTLRDFIEQYQVFFPEVAALIGIEICEAIGHAHSLGIIHRDLKPENMMIDRTGTLKLMDFGIAKVLDQQHQMTVTGSILGSPAHMAPEMLEGRELDVRSDLFSIGTILYWLSTGQLPFTGKNPHQVLRRILESDYPDPQQINPELPACLARCIRRCLAKRPEDRHASADELRAELQGMLSGLDLADPQQELKAFFLEPAASLNALRPKVISHLLERGRRLLKAKKHRPALEDLDRLLAMQPGHPEALALVSGLERRRQMARRLSVAGIILAGLLLLAAGFWGVTALWPAGPDTRADGGLDLGLALVGPLPNTDRSGPKTDGGSPTAIDGGPDRSDGGGLPDGSPAFAGADAPSKAPAGHPAGRGLRPPLVRKTDSRLQPIALRNPIEQPVVIKSEPFFDELLIDGLLVAKRGKPNQYGQVYRGKLATGRHRVTVRNQACLEEENNLVVPADPKSPAELVFPFRLKFKPALLVIDSPYPNSAVFVDSEFKGTTGASHDQPILIPIEGRTGQVRVRVRVTHPQAGQAQAEVLVRAGQHTTHAFETSAFTRTNQRSTDGGAS